MLTAPGDRSGGRAAIRTRPEQCADGVGVRSELPDATFEGGDEVRVTLLDVDLRRRRIGLAPDG